mgnify:CR=1 FL=1
METSRFATFVDCAGLQFETVDLARQNPRAIIESYNRLPR